MHAINLNFGYLPGLSTPSHLLERFWSLGGWAETLVQAGLRVTVIQRFSQNAVFQQAGVRYHFLADGHGADLRPWQVSRPALRLAAGLARQSIEEGEPALVHVNGLMYGLHTQLLRRVLPAAVPIVAQHHAEEPWSGPHRLAQRWSLQAADGFLFTIPEFAQPWIQLGTISGPERVFPVLVGSTRFAYQDRDQARRVSGLCGDPQFLWVGRLNDNKDPLTVLAGFEQLLDHLPGARLAMAFGEEDLLDQVRHRIGDSPTLNDAVRLLGNVAHDDLEPIYNSADYFILGSHHENYGYALVEAVACGVVPIVTDIPSFRLLTAGGTIGSLWPPGRVDALVETALATVSRPWSEQSTRARRYFQESLSWQAIGRRARDVYADLIARRVT